VDKYRLPPTSAEYLAYTAEDLLVEFFEDYFAEHPEQELRREVHEASGQPYYVTGDALIDKWEREVAEGRAPDFDEALTGAQRAHDDARRREQAEREGFDGIEEDFADVETR
jgi:hypothetical protein